MNNKISEIDQETGGLTILRNSIYVGITIVTFKSLFFWFIPSKQVNKINLIRKMMPVWFLLSKPMFGGKILFDIIGKFSDNTVFDQFPEMTLYF
jgi:hypothetical protein